MFYSYWKIANMFGKVVNYGVTLSTNIKKKKKTNISKRNLLKILSPQSDDHRRQKIFFIASQRFDDYL